MMCKYCEKVMHLTFTDEWVCGCGRKYNIKGGFISKDVKVKAVLGSLYESL